MRLFLASISVILACAYQVANAGYYQFDYCTVIDETDRVNSSGKKLQTVGQILRQDFVNFCKANSCTSNFKEAGYRNDLQALIDDRAIMTPLVKSLIKQADSIEVCINIEGSDWGSDDLAVGIDGIFNNKENWKTELQY